VKFLISWPSILSLNGPYWEVMKSYTTHIPSLMPLIQYNNLGWEVRCPDLSDVWFKSRGSPFCKGEKSLGHFWVPPWLQLNEDNSTSSVKLWPLGPPTSTLRLPCLTLPTTNHGAAGDARPCWIMQASAINSLVPQSQGRHLMVPCPPSLVSKRQLHKL
jgi:hypothetical protein